MVTITDVAAHAGVGAGTVSRVLNDSPNVSATTRSRVLAAIDVLDYRPNPLARGLSRGRPQTLGVLVPVFTHPSAIERLRGVVAALRGSRYDLVLFSVESPAHLGEHFAALARRDRADGLILMSLPHQPEQLASLRAAGVPTVLVDAFGEGVPAVVTDDVDGGRVATRHLVALGHREIAFIGEASDTQCGATSSSKRQQGYEEVLREAGIRVRRSYVLHGPHERAAARPLAEHLLALRTPPTAIFAASDTQATGVLEVARDGGLLVPDDLSVIGFDDIDISAYAGLTTVRQPLFDSGYLGARLLLDALDDHHVLGAEVHQLPLELVVRSTTAPPARRRRRRNG